MTDRALRDLALEVLAAATALAETERDAVLRYRQARLFVDLDDVPGLGWHLDVLAGEHRAALATVRRAAREIIQRAEGT
jgi:DUF1365 family protein